MAISTSFGNPSSDEDMPNVGPMPNGGQQNSPKNYGDASDHHGTAPAPIDAAPGDRGRPDYEVVTERFRHVVCVTPPGGEIAEGSGLKPHNMGKAPGLPTPDGKWKGYGDWLDEVPSVAQARARQKAGANLGLSAKYFPGVDVDIDDPAEAALIAELDAMLVEELGGGPVRWGHRQLGGAGRGEPT
jgi:hypothetical protein